jgi:hypothetical protein
VLSVGEGEVQRLVEFLAGGEDAQHKTGGFLEGEAVRDFNEQLCIHNAILRKATPLLLSVGTVDEPGHALAFVGSARFDAGPEGLNGACKVAADGEARAGDALDVFPVSWVLPGGDDFDEDLGEGGRGLG